MKTHHRNYNSSAVVAEDNNPLLGFWGIKVTSIRRSERLKIKAGKKPIYEENSSYEDMTSDENKNEVVAKEVSVPKSISFHTKQPDNTILCTNWIYEKLRTLTHNEIITEDTFGDDTNYINGAAAFCLVKECKDEIKRTVGTDDVLEIIITKFVDLLKNNISLIIAEGNYGSDSSNEGDTHSDDDKTLEYDNNSFSNTHELENTNDNLNF